MHMALRSISMRGGTPVMHGTGSPISAIPGGTRGWLVTNAVVFRRRPGSDWSRSIQSDLGFSYQVGAP